jgi:filamentous hemagglutinin
MSASASSSGTSVGTHMVSGKYELGKAVVGNALNNGSADQSDASTTKTAISGAQVTVNGVTTDTSKEALTDSDGKFVETDTKNSHRSLVNTDIADLQQAVQQEQADNMLGFKTVTTFTDEANRTLYKVGAQVYRVPPGCSDKTCAVLLEEEETKNLEQSQDGKVHLSNNGILNDLDGAVKYAQQHGGKSNPDGSKDYSDKPNNQYIVFAPEANNPLSELMIAGVQKSGLTPYVGLTNAEEKTSELVQQTTRQGNSIDIDSHSRGTLTTDNALQSINNQGGITDGNGNTIKPSIRLNNYGGAQNNESGNKTLQQVTGNENAQINSVVHPKDLVGASVVVGHNPATPNYSSKGTQVTNVESKDDGKGFFSNLWNILFGKATPHNCYGTSGGTERCTKQWDNIPTSNAQKIKPNVNYKSPVLIPQYQQVDKITPQVQQDSNAQMNQLLQATTPTLPPIAPIVQPNDKVETLQNFKQVK